MKTWFQLEEVAELLLSIYLFSLLPFAWWVYPVLFVVPDLSLVAMAAGSHVGGLVYNLLHHKGIAIGALIAGYWLNWPALALAGTLALGHASFDRLLGLGRRDGETFTHAQFGLFGALGNSFQKRKAPG
jgi:hypothetical protein